MPVLTIRDSLNAVVAGLGTGGMTQFGATLPVPQTYTPAQVLAETNLLVKRRRYVWAFTDGGTAATDAAESPIGFVGSTTNGFLITGLWWLPQVAVTLAAAAKILTLNKRTSGGGAVVIATAQTTSGDPSFAGNVVAFVAQPIVLSATQANRICAPATDTLTFAMTHASTGVAIAAATGASYMMLEYEEI